MTALTWIGARARWVLLAAIGLALAAPGLAAATRPALPALVAMVLALGMMRIDLWGLARTALRPRRLALTAGIAALGVPVYGAALWLGGHVLPEPLRPSLIYLAAAPPIASSAGLCFLLGFNARLALEVTVVATVLTPILGPLTVAALLGGAVPPGPLALRLFAMIAAGTLAAILLRRLIGPDRIARGGLALDGATALGMGLFVLPLFDGVGAAILARPGLAASVLALSIAANTGVVLAVRAALARAVPAEDAGALGLMAGNRTVALYLAVLPPEPVFALFVALYQLPMYAAPLVLPWLIRR